MNITEYDTGNAKSTNIWSVQESLQASEKLWRKTEDKLLTKLKVKGNVFFQ